MFNKNFQGPDSGEPSRRGSLLTGLIGSLLAALLMLTAALSFWQYVVQSTGEHGGTLLLLMILMGPIVGLGYRLFRGRRSVKAAMAVMIPVTLLACAMTPTAILLSTAYLEAKGEISFLTLLAYIDWRDFWQLSLVQGWPLTAICMGAGAFGLLLGRNVVLSYADWTHTPWRVAHTGGNGMLYNAPPQFLPARNLPKSFRVGGKLEVEGETLRTLPLLGRGKTFDAKDIAGVIIGHCTGCNVLYNHDNEVLAKFAWSMYGADMLIAYLLDRKVPIQAPKNLGPLFRPEAPLRGELPEKFILAMPPDAIKMFHRVGAVFLVIFVLMLTAISVFWQIGLLPGILCAVLVCGTLFPGLVGWLFLRVAEKHRLEIDGESLRYVSRLGKRRTFSAKEIGSASWHGSYYEIQDKQWKRLAMLDPGLENLELLEPYMKRHCPEMNVRESPIKRR